MHHILKDFLFSLGLKMTQGIKKDVADMKDSTFTIRQTSLHFQHLQHSPVLCRGKWRKMEMKHQVKVKHSDGLRFILINAT